MILTKNTTLTCWNCPSLRLTHTSHWSFTFSQILKQRKVWMIRSTRSYKLMFCVQHSIALKQMFVWSMTTLGVLHLSPWKQTWYTSSHSSRSSLQAPTCHPTQPSRYHPEYQPYQPLFSWGILHHLPDGSCWTWQDQAWRWPWSSSPPACRRWSHAPIFPPCFQWKPSKIRRNIMLCIQKQGSCPKSTEQVHIMCATHILMVNFKVDMTYTVLLVKCNKQCHKLWSPKTPFTVQKFCCNCSSICQQITKWPQSLSYAMPTKCHPHPNGRLNNMTTV